MDDGDVRSQTLKTSGCRKARSLTGLKNVFALGLMLCLSAAPPVSRAQGTPSPVLDPADIFTDAVEVVETLPVIRRTVELSPNNGQRILYYYNRMTSETEAHPYPKGMEDIHDWEAWTEGNYLLVTDSSSLPTITFDAAWIFSPDNGNFSRPEEACGFVKARPGTGVWILYQNPRTEVYHLCFTETGELGNPLPDELQPKLCDSFSLVRPTAISPDGKWIVFADCGDAFSAYAYRVETGQVNYLGTAEEPYGHFEVVRWIDDTTPVIHSFVLGTQQNRYVHIADVTKANSLELAALQYVSWPQYFEELPGYVWVSDDESLIYQYDLETRETSAISVPRCSLYIASCIAVPNQISPGFDGVNYVAILEHGVQADTSTLNVYEVDSSQSIYDTTFTVDFGVTERDRPLEWITEDTFILFDVDYLNLEGSGISYPTRLVSLDRVQQLQETIIENIYSLSLFNPRVSLSPNKRHVLIWLDNPEESITIGILDLITLETLAVTKPLDPRRYRVDILWRNDGLLSVFAVNRNPE